LIADALPIPVFDAPNPPNTIHATRDLWWIVTMSYLLFDRAHLWVSRETIWPLPTELVSLGTDGRRLVPTYQGREGPIWSWIRWDPGSYACAYGPASAIVDTADADQLTDSRRASRIKNRSMPDLVVSAPDLSEPERSRLEAAWNHRFRENAAGSVAVVNQEIGVNVVQVQDQFLFAEATTQEILRRKIAEAYGVPLGVLGGNPTEAERAAFARNALDPLVQSRDAAIESHWPNLRNFSPTQLPSLPYEDLDLLRSNVLTINEVRARRGLLPVKWGNEPLPALQRIETNNV